MRLESGIDGDCEAALVTGTGLVTLSATMGEAVTAVAIAYTKTVRGAIGVEGTRRANSTAQLSEVTWLGTETHLELRGVGSYVGEGEVDGRILGTEGEGADMGVQ